MQQFCVRWNSYQSNLQNVFPKLLNNEHFVDVTLACEAQMIKCHKVVLSACSTYFEQLLVQNPCQHPIIFMKDMKHWEVQALVDFMYKGEVNVSQEEIPTLLKAAEALQIRGLCGADRQQDSNAVSLPPETTLSDSGGRETPPAKRRKFPEQQSERSERREKSQATAPTPKPTNTSSGPSVTSTPTSSSNDLAAVLGVSGPITASVTSAPFRDTECNNSGKDTSEDVSDRSNIKREHVEQEESYFENDGDYESFDIQDDSNSMNPDISMPTSPLDQAGPSSMPGMQDSKPTAAWQHLEYLLGSTARRGRPKRDDPSLKAAAHLVMDRSYTLRQAALQFQIPPTTLRNYMKRSGMLRLPLKRGRPISSASSYHFYSEPFRMPGNFANQAYPRASAPQYPLHQQQQYQQQYQNQQHSQQSQLHQQQHTQQQSHHSQQMQQQPQQTHQPQHVSQHHHMQQASHIQQQSQPQSQSQSQYQHQTPHSSQHVSQQGHGTAAMSQQQQQYGFNSEFGSGFGDFGNEYCDIQELRPPKLETSRTPPVEIDLDSEPDQEAVPSVEGSEKIQGRSLPSNEGEGADEEDQEDEVDEEEEEEEDEEEEESGTTSSVTAKPSSVNVPASGEADEDSDSESDSDESEQSDQPPLSSNKFNLP